MFHIKKHNIVLNKYRKKDANSVYLFTNARDEANIAEWITHHLLLGFDKIFIFDHLSKEPIIDKIRAPQFKGKVFVMRVGGTGNIKIALMKQAVDIAKRDGVSWMLYLDADEYLLINKYNHIKEFLGGFPFADSVAVNWLLFGSSGHTIQPKGLLTENFVKSNALLDKHVKTFVRPYIVKDVVNPHFYVISNQQRCFDANKRIVPMGPFNERPLPFTKSVAYIAHYHIQSEEQFIKRKKSRTQDDGTTNTTNITEIHNMYNDVLNNQMQDQVFK